MSTDSLIAIGMLIVNESQPLSALWDRLRGFSLPEILKHSTAYTLLTMCSLEKPEGQSEIRDGLWKKKYQNW